MCEILGVTSDRAYNANGLLQGFFSHSSANADGWGLAVFRGRGVTLEKEPVKALDSKYLWQRLSREVSGRNIFAHIRRATVGLTEYANCHPFIWDDDSGRSWTLVHNGTIFEPKGTCDYRVKQEGTTDSERLILYIIERCNEMIREHGVDYMETPENRFRLLDEIVGEMSYNNKLNILVFDGEYMYVHTNSPETLYQIVQDEARIFATRPVLTEDLTDPEWEQVPINQLHVFKDGSHVFSGKPHENTFDESEHDFVSLYSAFAAL